MGRKAKPEVTGEGNHGRKTLAIDYQVWKELANFAEHHRITIRTAAEICLRTGLNKMKDLPPIYETLAASIATTAGVYDEG